MSTSLAGSIRLRNRNTTITTAPSSNMKISTIFSRNSNRFKTNSTLVSKNSNVLHKQRIKSYWPSPYLTMSIDQKATPTIFRPNIRKVTRTKLASPVHKTLRYLKAKIQPRKKSYLSASRHGSNKRSHLGNSTNDSKPNFDHMLLKYYK